MHEKILSVSIAAYNVASTLKEALDPFTLEGVREYVDVMIVDDGSKDNTAEIAREYEANYPGTFRLISKENGGWGSTLNAGIRVAKGKYFKQLDGDDYYSYENLRSFLEYLQGVDADLIYSPFVTFDDATGGILRVVGTYGGSYRFFPFDRVVNLEECEDLVPAMHCLTVRTSRLQEENVTITEHCFYTDVEYVLKACNICKTIAFFEKPIYYYRLARSGQSMSLAGVRKHYNDHQKMLMTMLAYYKDYVKDPFAKKMFEDRLDGACNMQYIFYFALKCTPEHKKELKNYDKELKAKYPDFYERVKGKQVNLLRKTGFLGYWIIAKQKMSKDRRLKQNIFEGC